MSLRRSNAIGRMAKWIERLGPLFVHNPEKAISIAESEIIGRRYGSIDEFRRSLQSSYPIRTCQAAWNKQLLVGKCHDCGLRKHSCLCLRCFIAGGHMSHNANLSLAHSGNCDCGDAVFWSSDGFCPHHPGPEADPDMAQLGDLLRSKLQAAFRVALTSFVSVMATGPSKNLIRILSWLGAFIEAGDGVRRVVSKVVCDDVDMTAFLAGLRGLSDDSSKALVSFLGSVTNDSYFQSHFGGRIAPFYPSLLEQYLALATAANANPKGPPLVGLRSFLNQCYHYLGYGGMSRLVTHKDFEWDELYLGVVHVQFEFIRAGGNSKAFETASSAFFNHYYISRGFRAAGELEEHRARYCTFIESVAREFADFEGFGALRRGDGTYTDPTGACTSCFYITSLIGKYLRRIVEFTPFSDRVFDVFVGWIKERVMAGKLGGTFTTSILGGALFSTQLALHILVFEMLRLCPDPRRKLQDVCERQHLDYNHFCKAMALMPLRWLTVATIDTYELIDKVPSSVRPTARETIASGYRDIGFFRPLFAMIQLAFALCDDKNGFIEMIAHTFGFFDLLPLKQSTDLEVLLMNFIASLLIDRNAMFFKKAIWVANGVVTRLKVRDFTVVEMGRSTRPLALNEGALAELLAPVIRIAQDSISLMCDATWNIAQPWLMPALIAADWLDILFKRQPNALFPFAEFTHLDVQGADLEGSFRSQFLFALLYDILYHLLTRPSLVIHYALNLLLIMSEYSAERTFNESPKLVVADSVPSLAAQLSDNFQEFVRTPVYYRLGCPSSLYQILERLGHLGIYALRHANLGRKRLLVRPDVAALKASVRAQFDARKQQFEESYGNSTNAGHCLVCHVSDASIGCYVYPCLSWKTCIPSYIEKVQLGLDSNDLVSGRQVFCCAHLVHNRCLPDRDESQQYHCPNCNGARNCAIVKFSDDLREFQDPSAHRAAMSFRSMITRNTEIIDLIEILANHIIVLEARTHSRLELLEEEETKVFYRNFYLTILLLYVNRLVPGFRRRQGDRALSHFISDMVAAFMYTQRELSWEGVMGLIHVDGKFGRDLLLYLRQVTLFLHFMARIRLTNLDNFVDWDILLDPGWLANRYNVPPRLLHGIQIERFRPIPLPDGWVDLLLPPYELDIIHMEKRIDICLVTGMKVMRQQVQLDGDDDALPIHEYMTSKWKRSPIMLMSLTNRRATEISFATLEFNQYLMATPVWLDKAGFPDIGFDQGRVLWLDRERLNGLFDDFVSGKFMNRMKW